MKKFVRFGLFCFAGLFALFSLFFAALQTKWAKEGFKEWLIATAKKQGIELSVGRLEGNPPFKWTFHDVRASFSENTFFAKTVKARFAFFPLLHKQLELSYVSLSEANYTNTTGSLKGDLEGKILFDGKEGILKLLFHDLQIAGQTFETLQVNAVASIKNTKWQGPLSFEARDKDFFIKGSSNIEMEPAFFAFNDLIFVAPDSNFSGNFIFWKDKKELEGALYGSILNLEHFDAFFSYPHLSGSVGVEVQADKEKLLLQLSFQDLRYREMFAPHLTLEGTFFDLFNTPKGVLSLEGEKAYFPHAYLSNYSLNTFWQDDKWPFELHVKGLWKEELEMEASGYWKHENDETLLHFDTLSGVLLDKPFASHHPFNVGWGKEFYIDPSLFSIQSGNLAASMHFNKTSSALHLKASHVPLEYLSLFSSRFFLQGETSFQADLAAEETNLRGELFLTLEQITLSSDNNDRLQAKGSLQAHIEKGTVQIHAQMQAQEKQSMELLATFPISFSPFPLKVKIDEQKPLSGELTIEGKMEELFDFVNMGSHRLTGFVSAHLFLSKNWRSPALQGQALLQDGSYENYFTGTALKKIYIAATAQQNTIDFEKMEARDNDQGLASAKGSLILSPQNHYPYIFEIFCENLNLLQSETFGGNFTGPLTIKGTNLSSLAEGTLSVTRANFNIPDQLPLELPQLPVTYINQPKYANAPSLLSSPFTFHVDLDLSALGSVFVRGKGLESEWQGEAHVTGANMNLAASGPLHLVKGDFLFSGKRFSLTQGEISFRDKPSPGAFLFLSGTLALPEVTVTAILKGPLTSPQLTFQSIPHLPTSSILSLILFNKDISEISPFQAIQLAEAIVSLSGGAGPNVLETIRKSLGVDRLNITSSQTGSDEIQVQIGKYLTHGVMVTLSQGTESSQILVEVELKKGFILQAETQDNQEGKFSLKWNKNY